MLRGTVSFKSAVKLKILLYANTIYIYEPIKIRLKVFFNTVQYHHVISSSEEYMNLFQYE